MQHSLFACLAAIGVNVLTNYSSYRNNYSGKTFSENRSDVFPFPTFYLNIYINKPLCPNLLFILLI